MAKINVNNSGKYASSGSNDFFSLQDDGDIARVRMLYDQPDGSDLDYFLLHEVEIDDKKRYVNCLAVDEEGDLHPEDCPLCNRGFKRIEKLFIQLYDEDDGVVKTWDRGKSFVPKLLTYVNRYGSLVEQPIEIERQGKRGNKKTTYDLFQLEKDNAVLEDYPEKQELLGSLILDLSEEQIEEVIDGTFSLDDNSSKPKRRGRQQSRRASSRDEERPQTRNRRSRREEDEEDEEEQSPRGRRRTTRDTERPEREGTERVSRRGRRARDEEEERETKNTERATRRSRRGRQPQDEEEEDDAF